MSSSTFVITGTSRGIGFELVRQLSAKGHTVFACARNPDASEQLQKIIDDKHVIPIKLDTADEQSIQSAAKEVEKRAPEGIDVLINNAGISEGGRNATIEKVARKAMLKTYEINVCGTSNVTQVFLSLLRKRGQNKIKKIVNISSTLGSISSIDRFEDSANVTDYCLSKAALNMLTHLTGNALAKENFIVYACCPGHVRTDMGGQDAPLGLEESITNQITKLEEVTLKDNGSFFGNDGNVIPW
ncbi:4-dihydrotrisporin dehydrogenase [Blakeslea trispora]|nr:4-dihydrotrisporin dehydrogenase [Blakeslea trispora]